MYKITIRILRFVVTVIYISVGWLIAVPLAYLTPKDPNLIVFIGRDNGKFLDNLKYLFHYAIKHKGQYIECCYLTEDIETYQKLEGKNLPVILFPSLSSIYKLLRTSTVIVDNWMWILRARYHLLIKSKKIQIWHGIPLKKIQLNNPHNLERLRSLRLWTYCYLVGLYPYYDAVISTSPFYTKNAFSSAFKTQNILESGYPRNDCFFMKSDDKILLNTDNRTINKVKKYKDYGCKVVVYTPTYRDTGSDPVKDNALDLKKMSLFAQKNSLVVVIKLHPDPNYLYEVSQMENILIYNNSSDIYPFLPKTDFMITDYSSIYFDYLLLNKPIIFFPYDYEKYVKNDRDLIFDYESMTPGPKCYNQDQLEQQITNIISGKDDYLEKRNDLLNTAFEHKDGKASERIWNYVSEKFLKDGNDINQKSNS